MEDIEVHRDLGLFLGLGICSALPPVPIHPLDWRLFSFRAFAGRALLVAVVLSAAALLALQVGQLGQQGLTKMLGQKCRGQQLQLPADLLGLLVGRGSALQWPIHPLDAHHSLIRRLPLSSAFPVCKAGLRPTLALSIAALAKAMATGSSLSRVFTPKSAQTASIVFR